MDSQWKKSDEGTLSPLPLPSVPPLTESGILVRRLVKAGVSIVRSQVCAREHGDWARVWADVAERGFLRSKKEPGAYLCRVVVANTQPPKIYQAALAAEQQRTTPPLTRRRTRPAAKETTAGLDPLDALSEDEFEALREETIERSGRIADIVRGFAPNGSPMRDLMRARLADFQATKSSTSRH